MTRLFFLIIVLFSPNIQASGKLNRVKGFDLRDKISQSIEEHSEEEKRWLEIRGKKAFYIKDNIKKPNLKAKLNKKPKFDWDEKELK